MSNMEQQIEHNVEQMDRLAQELLSGWAQIALAGGQLTTDYQVPIQKAFEYRSTRRTADDRRKRNWLDPKLEAEEKESMRIFIEVTRQAGLLDRLTSR